ncbi:MAG TPA: enoyl-CoA hydratase [Xanthomonadales bacterium]|nr:enoyl-CoA hydratase [Xanthomonadales bacterium]
MTYHFLHCTDHAAVRDIVINRPDKLNALNAATIAELDRAFSEAGADPNVRVVVLSGAGGKAFVAGADISELATASPLSARALSRAGQALMLRIERLGKPVIARIDGYALGGGLELAMACHLRIASDSARLGLPEITLGLLPGFGGTQRLTRIAGRAAALELCLTGTPIDAARAHALGLVSQVHPADRIVEATRTLAERLARSAPIAMTAILDAILVGSDCGIEAGLDYETQQFAVCCTSADMREGTQAFLEKRPAHFTGH